MSGAAQDDDVVRTDINVARPTGIHSDVADSDQLDQYSQSYHAWHQRLIGEVLGST